MPHDFIAKLTEVGGPAPVVELDSLVRQLEEEDGDGRVPDHVWFATRATGARWERNENGFNSCLIFANATDGNRLHVVTATIVDRTTQMPDKNRGNRSQVGV